MRKLCCAVCAMKGSGLGRCSMQHVGRCSIHKLYPLTLALPPGRSYYSSSYPVNLVFVSVEPRTTTGRTYTIPQTVSKAASAILKDTTST